MQFHTIGDYAHRLTSNNMRIAKVTLTICHPTNSHDDMLWALALAVAATRHEAEGKPDSFIFF